MDNNKKEHFLPHEIKWQGKEKPIFFVPTNVAALSFGLAAFIFCISMFFVAYIGNRPLLSNFLFDFLISLGSLVGIFFGLAVPYMESKKAQNHVYVITDNKIIIYRETDIDSYFFKAEDIQSLIVEINKKNFGNVLFDFKSRENIPKYRSSNAHRFIGFANPALPYKLILQKKHSGIIKDNVKDIKNYIFDLKEDIIEQTLLPGEKIIYKRSPRSLPTKKKNAIINYIVTNFGVIIYINSVNIYIKYIIYSDLEKIELNTDEYTEDSVSFNPHTNPLKYSESKKDPYYFYKWCFYDMYDAKEMYDLILEQKKLYDLGKRENYE